MEQDTSGRWLVATFGVTIVLGAFLLFQVQPLVSKAILPWFGGSAAVWTTCILFFQVVLFGGYVYAHLLQRWLQPRRQVGFHLGLAAVALLLLSIAPVVPTASWKPPAGSNATFWILLLLTCTVGLPYFALSATSPLVQAWFSRTYPGRSPYRLYSLSNAGSLAALLSYPFVFEPAFELRTQSVLWSGAFALYAALCAATLVGLWKGAEVRGQGPGVRGQGPGVRDSTSPNLQISKSPNPSGPHPSPPRAPTEGWSGEGTGGWLDRFRWVALPACASLVLLAATNHVCQDVAVVPFLWVVPLALYLLSFIITFEHARWYVRPLWAAGAVLMMMGSAANDFNQLSQSDMPPPGLFQVLTLYLGAMFCTCMVCHGELARLKPSPRRLTEFYLLLSAGGAMGGIFVGVIAPLCFRDYFEWQISVAVSIALSACLLIVPRWRTEGDTTRPRAGIRGAQGAVASSPRDRKGSRGKTAAVSIRAGSRKSFYLPLILRGGLLLGVGVVVVAYLAFWVFRYHYMLDRARTFFGVVSVSDLYSGNAGRHERRLKNGHITHGQQFVDPAKRRWPTTYYGETSGVGRAIRYLQRSGPVRVGAVGLGIGTLAAYARPGDVFRFYEINPAVEDMARKHFTYLADCRGKAEVVLGDARLSLEAERESEPHQKYDILVLDAFTGDAIPVHLLTREAFEVYTQRLKPGGVIAAHVSNDYLRLAPVVRRLGEEFGMRASRVFDRGDPKRLMAPSFWVIVSQDGSFLEANPSEPRDWGEDAGPAPLWTDQYSNLFQILKSGADRQPAPGNQQSIKVD
jgi:hypothetical protein